MSDRISDHRFENRPRPEDLPEQWKILRASKKGTPRCVIVDEDVLGCYVHYWSGRTRPCKRENCEICEKGQQPRWRGYLSVITPAPSQPRLLEVTPSVIGDIDRWLKQEGSLRGSLIKLTRRGNVQNGELICEIGKQAGFDVSLPPCPDVPGILARIWRLTHSALPSEAATDRAAELYTGRRSDVATQRNGKAGKS